MSDPSSPNHYKGSVECIDVLDACMSEDQFEGFLHATALKTYARRRFTLTGLLKGWRSKKQLTNKVTLRPGLSEEVKA